MRSFRDQNNQRTVVFGEGAATSIDDELARVQAHRVLVLTTPRRAGVAALLDALGQRCAGVFDEARTQVPRGVADRAVAVARSVDADWILAQGGGTAIGLAKAVALELDVQIAAIPTTYSGSEMTHIWGISEAGQKTTGRSPKVRPRLVLYDPALLVSLPFEIARTSLYNALAHAVEALYDATADDALKDKAEHAARCLVRGLRALHVAPSDPNAAAEALYGAHLAGETLDQATMALHHKLAHTLGGSFGVPHADAHAILLPHTLAYNHTPESDRRLRRALDCTDPAATLYDLAVHTGIPTRLSAVGFELGDIPRATSLSLERPYPNPRPVTEDGLSALLHDAVLGRRPSDQVLSQPLERQMSSDPYATQTGFGNALSSEAVPGALPTRQNTPLNAPFGLFAEQVQGTGFTVRRSENLRTWMYRLRPQIPVDGWERMGNGQHAGSFEDGIPTPEILRYRPLPYPEAPTDLVQGISTFSGAGDPGTRTGMAIHRYAATADMVDKVFSNADGDWLLVPQEGAVRIRSELGFLQVRPGQIAILPRGLRYQFSLPDGRSRGFVSELFNGHHQLPERGPIGANGLADERHFHAPVASFEDREAPHEHVHKHGGALWRTTVPHSPFDVVAWHGSYAPFRFDLLDFVPYGSLTVDHGDPSVLTVLTHPHDDHGRNALDFAVFRGRWDPTENTFRPPFLHRNSAIEFNAVIRSAAASGPYQAGAYTYTPALSAHGVSASSYRREAARSAAGQDAPVRSSDDELWVQWESTYPMRVMPWVLDEAERDPTYADQFRNYPTAELP